MKRPISARTTIVFALLLGAIAPVRAWPDSPISDIKTFHALTNQEAAKSLPVLFEATVTYYEKGNVDLFVQDGDTAVYVETKPNASLVTGDRVLVRGTTRASFRPEILSQSVTLLRHGQPPSPVPATFAQMIRTELDCRRVTVRAVVRSADLISNAGLKDIYLKLVMDGGSIDAEVAQNDTGLLNDLLDAEVEITGAVAGRFDSKTQMTGILLEVPSLGDVKILKRSATRPEMLPVTPMDEILKNYEIQDRRERVRVHGTVTYQHAGSSVVIQNDDKSLWIDTQLEDPLRIGDLVDVSGFPDVRNGFLILTHGSVLNSHVESPVAAMALSPAELGLGTHAYDLVSVEGKVVSRMREEAQDEYLLQSNHRLFSAVYRHPERGVAAYLPPMNDVPRESMVKLTGICLLDNGDKFQGPVAFTILLRSPADIVVVARPSLLNVENLAILVGVLLVSVLCIGTRGWLIERRVRWQTAGLARIEQRRGRILEDINGNRPLAEIIEEVTELVSFKLSGAPCWCQIADGAKLGNWPPRLDGLRVVLAPIPGRSGGQLGEFFAAFDQRTKPAVIESEALSMAAGLATLAIETRRLYTDLLHRSEFDQLTEIHNRFSLDKQFDDLIESARREAGIFGLIYIDLNAFKEVNDRYGHNVGDIYLQEVALRMKKQLRPADMLARLGGDEFAVLVPIIRNHADVSEIAVRLERSFDLPFDIDGLLLRGSASMGIAIYPEDGTTKDSLLDSADRAMYAVKHARTV